MLKTKSKRDSEKPPQPIPLPNKHTAEGSLRRIGVEIEFCGLSLKAIERLVAEATGGRIERINDYISLIHSEQIGKIRIELDAILFREMKLRDFFTKIKIDKVKADLASDLETAMSTEAARFIPYEIIFPPLPAGRLPELEPIREALSSQAEGTGMSIFNAFGTHFNPELPSLNAACLLSYIRAFIVQADRLAEAHKVDASRKILPFIDPFPKDYIREVLSPDYAPDLSQLIDDYLDLNATRNRPLDMLPVFAHLAPEQIKQRLPKEKISARPTLHYRLPNCQINESSWSITAEWNHWVRLVERLSNDPEKLSKRSRLHLWELEHPFRARLRRLFT